MLPAMVIAVDGPAGSGKSSVCRGVAQRLDLQYLDTGAMYRAITLAVLQAGGDPANADQVKAVLGKTAIASVTDPMAPAILLDGQNVSAAVRGPDVTAAVSAVSAIPEVRQAMVDLQRAEVRRAQESQQGIVVEGRDIGSVVLPDAHLKIFLTADASVRAQRRAAEIDGAEVAATQVQLETRDALDAGREVSPMTQARDAVIVDTTSLTLPEVIDAVCAQALGIQGVVDGREA